ncbi:uncharacterized protein LOC106076135 [Biomphalaria glabrata]|uniref:Uncharacterized protein LOC106076135 n=1 Tax=Biomphalaria glabrata TaxID=6526 RepID=A0A9U8ELF4_BIOGL|nr:uncharacterized protein LOC106076135 [Biomphalaria glabrata]
MTNCGRKRKDSRNPPEDPERFVVNWFNEIMRVLERPTIAIATFIIGVGFIVLASKQVRWSVDFLEKYGIVSPSKEENALDNLKFLAVFLFVWIDIVLVSYLKNLLLQAYQVAERWFSKAKMVVQKISENELEETKKKQQPTAPPPPPQQQNQQHHSRGRSSGNHN